MQSYKLPKATSNQSMECTMTNSTNGCPKPMLGFDNNLHILKDKLGTIPRHRWNKNIRRETNVWEDGSKPLNRAALKFDEVATEIGLFRDLPEKKGTFIFLCEGPGGFMECTLKRRNNKDDKFDMR